MQITNYDDVVRTITEDEDLLRQIVTDYEKTTSNKNRYSCSRCHSKDNLCIFQSDTGAWMYKCQSGCGAGTSLEFIMDRAGVSTRTDAICFIRDHYMPNLDIQSDTAFEKMDSFLKSFKHFDSNKTYLRHHYYRDNSGDIIAAKVLYKDIETGKKIGSWFVVNDNRAELSIKGKTKPIEPILYNTHLIKQDAEIICITEGEKDADTLTNLGFLAVSAQASGDWKEEYLKQIQHCSMFYIFTDNDSVGQSYAERIIASLKTITNDYSITYCIKVVNIPMFQQKADITDYVDVLKQKELTRKEIRSQINQLIYRSENILSIYDVHADKLGYYKWVKVKGEEGTFFRSYLTDFVMKVKENVICIDDETLNYHTVDIIRSTGEVEQRQFKADSMNNVDQFKKTLNSVYVTFSGKLADLDDIKKRTFNSNYPTRKIVAYSGVREIEDKWYYIEHDKCIHGNVINTDYSINTMMESMMIVSNILDYEPITNAELLELRQHIFKFNQEKIAYSIVGYAIATLFKSRLKKLGYRFPHMINIGEAGSGKSETTKQILGGLLGVNRFGSAAGITKYTIDNFTASNNTIPYILDEYKPYKMAKWRVDLISEVMRNTYDNLISSRGTGRGTIRQLKPRASIVLAGEAGTDETAVIERSVMLTMSKHTTLIPEQTASYQWLIKNRNLLTKLSRLLIVHATTMPDEVLEQLYRASYDAISSDIATTRIHHAIAINLLGITILNMVMKDIDLVHVAKVMSDNSIEEVGNESKSIVELTLEEIDNALKKIVDSAKETHSIYTKINKGEELALRINVIYPEFTRYIKTYNTGFEALTEKEFVKMLRKTRYFAGYRKATFQPEVDGDPTNISNFVKAPIKKNAYILKVAELEGLNLENLLE